jgi:hypothetical protein
VPRTNLIAVSFDFRSNELSSLIVFSDLLPSPLFFLIPYLFLFIYWPTRPRNKPLVSSRRKEIGPCEYSSLGKGGGTGDNIKVFMTAKGRHKKGNPHRIEN